MRKQVLFGMAVLIIGLTAGCGKDDGKTDAPSSVVTEGNTENTTYDDTVYETKYKNITEGKDTDMLAIPLFYNSYNIQGHEGKTGILLKLKNKDISKDLKISKDSFSLSNANLNISEYTQTKNTKGISNNPCVFFTKFYDTSFGVYLLDKKDYADLLADKNTVRETKTEGNFVFLERDHNGTDYFVIYVNEDDNVYLCFTYHIYGSMSTDSAYTIKDNMYTYVTTPGNISYDILDVQNNCEQERQIFNIKDDYKDYVFIQDVIADALRDDGLCIYNSEEIYNYSSGGVLCSRKDSDGQYFKYDIKKIAEKNIRDDMYLFGLYGADIQARDLYGNYEITGKKEDKYGIKTKKDSLYIVDFTDCSDSKDNNFINFKCEIEGFSSSL